MDFKNLTLEQKDYLKEVASCFRKMIDSEIVGTKKTKIDLYLYKWAAYLCTLAIDIFEGQIQLFEAGNPRPAYMLVRCLAEYSTKLRFYVLQGRYKIFDWNIKNNGSFEEIIDEVLAIKDWELGEGKLAELFKSSPEHFAELTEQQKEQVDMAIKKMHERYPQGEKSKCPNCGHEKSGKNKNLNYTSFPNMISQFPKETREYRLREDQCQKIPILRGFFHNDERFLATRSFMSFRWKGASAMLHGLPEMQDEVVRQTSDEDVFKVLDKPNHLRDADTMFESTIYIINMMESVEMFHGKSYAYDYLDKKFWKVFARKR